jgi:hypothetical protein
MSETGRTVARPFFASWQIAGSEGQTPWSYWEHTFADAGTYTLRASVRDDGGLDSWEVLPSFLGLDGVTLSLPGQLNPSVTLLRETAGGLEPVAVNRTTGPGHSVLIEAITPIEHDAAPLTPAHLVVRIEGAEGSDGLYDAQILLNATQEQESLGGNKKDDPRSSHNDDLAASQDLESRFVATSGMNQVDLSQQTTVSGTTDIPDSAGVIDEQEPNHLQPGPPDLTAVAQSLDAAGWNLTDNPSIIDSTHLPHITVRGSCMGSLVA